MSMNKIPSSFSVISLFVLFLVLITPLQDLIAQRNWIFLKTKAMAYSVSDVSERELKRRANHLPQHLLIDEYDLPVSPVYIRKIEQTGAKVITVSRWLNAVSVEATSQQLQSIAQLPEVQKIQAVLISRKIIPVAEKELFLQKQGGGQPGTTDDPFYGTSKLQVASVNATPLHRASVTGNGVVIGMLDDGFNNHRTHFALRNITVLKEYDFVQRDSNTSRAYGEYQAQGNHGAATLSVIGGYAPGRLIGVAYGASYILAKTGTSKST